jgi:Tfp pilus assembly protein PilO
MKIRKLPKSTAIAMIIGGDLVLLVLGWFLLVSPQRATAKSIARSAQATEVQLAEAKRPKPPSLPTVQPKQPVIQTSPLYRLAKAMPMTTDMPNLILELNQVVRSSGVQLTSMSPSPADPTTGATSITLAVGGDFYTLTDLLYRLRTLVSVRHGDLDVYGRLFSVKSVGFTPAGSGAQLNASVVLETFSFGAVSAAAAAAAPPAVPAPTDTTGTTTTSSAAAYVPPGH